MGKVEIGIYFCVTADVLKKFYRDVSGVVLYQPDESCPKSLILIGCHGNRKATFLKKKYSKIFFSEAIRGIMTLAST